MDNAFVKEFSIKIEPDTLYQFDIIMCFKYNMIKLLVVSTSLDILVY